MSQKDNSSADWLDCLVSSSSACGRFTRAMECGDYQPQPRVCTHGGLGRKRLGFWQHVQHWVSSDSHACYDNVWMLMNAISSSPLHRSSLCLWGTLSPSENTGRRRWHLGVRLEPPPPPPRFLFSMTRVKLFSSPKKIVGDAEMAPSDLHIWQFLFEKSSRAFVLSLKRRPRFCVVERIDESCFLNATRQANGCALWQML